MYSIDMDIDRPVDDEFTDERPHAPEPYRRDFYLTVLVTIFTMAEIWAALVVLATFHATGPTAVAVWVTLTGAVTAVLIGWHHVLRRDRQYIRR